MADRGANGRFLPGNAGRPPGAKDSAKRTLAMVCRELVEGSEDVHFVVKGQKVGLLELVTQRVSKLRGGAMGTAVAIDFLKLVLAYGWGKPQQKIVIGDEDESPDAILRQQMKARNERLSAAAASADGGGGDGE